MKDVLLLTGAGQIGMAIARRMGHGKKIVLGDKDMENACAAARTLTDAGFDAVAMETDISSRASIRELVASAQDRGEIALFVNAAGVSPSQASIETILKVDLYGTAVLLEEVGKVIREGGAGLVISSQSGHSRGSSSSTGSQLISSSSRPTSMGPMAACRTGAKLSPMNSAGSCSRSHSWNRYSNSSWLS